MHRSTSSCLVMESMEPRTLLASVAYDFSKVAQTIESIGGNYAKAPFYDTANDAIGDYTLDNLKPRYVRVPILLTDWEPANDNADPQARDWSHFNDAGKVHDIFLMMKEYEARGLTIIASVFDAPDWMVSNPDKVNQRIVPADNWDEMTESISSFLEYAKANYGVSVDFLSVNEANGGYKLLFSGQQMADFIEQAGPALTGKSFGSPKWLVGDTYRVKDTVSYASTILADSGAKPYLGPIAYHTWWSETIDSSYWKQISDLGKKYGKRIWATEIGYDANAWIETPWIFPTWQNAERLAVTYHKALTLARSNAALYWQYQDDFPLMSPSTGTKYYAYYVVKGLADNLPAGSQMVPVTSDNSSVLALAAKQVWKGSYVSQLINTSSSDKTMTLSNLPNGPVTLIRTSSGGEKSRTIGTYTVVNGKLTLTLRHDSVNILKGSLENTPPPPVQTVISATDDATVRSGAYASMNFGSATDLISKEANSADNDREAYLRFDISGISSISSAKLRLYGRLSDSQNSSLVTRIYASSNTGWSESSITWDNKPARSSTTALASFTVTGTSAQWYEIDLSSYLKNELAAGHGAVTLILDNPTASSSQSVFSSRQAASDQPQLLLT